LLIIIGVIIAVCAVLTLIGWLLYRRFKKGSSQVIKSKPDQTNSAIGSPGQDEEEYEPQYHPKAEIGNIFGDSDKQKKKVNQADDVAEEEEKDSR